MSRALVIAAGAVIVPVAVALAITNSDWFSGDSAAAALLASDVRPARPTVGTRRPGGLRAAIPEAGRQLLGYGHALQL
ncbi:MAG: hypothetical protein E6J43_04810 [Chloroflexi bacterium]|nr:MAG: hypothetical protein E6J43_04810 [Chloroflexota bacterium]